MANKNQKVLSMALAALMAAGTVSATAPVANAAAVKASYNYTQFDKYIHVAEVALVNYNQEVVKNNQYVQRYLATAKMYASRLTGAEKTKATARINKVAATLQVHVNRNYNYEQGIIYVTQGEAKLNEVGPEEANKYLKTAQMYLNRLPNGNQKNTLTQKIADFQAEIQAKAGQDEAALKAAAEEKVAALEAAVADLSTQAKVDAAKTAKAAAEEAVAKLAEADKAAFQTRIDAAQKKITDAEAALAELKVESVSATNLREVVVTFSKDVDTDTAGATGNYTFASGSGLSVTAADVNGKTVTLTVTGASQQQSADLTIDGVKSLDGNVIGKTTQNVKFLDVTAPTVLSVDAVGPKTVKVKFSEPLQSAPTFSLNDGTIAIVSTAFNAGESEATLTLGTAPASGTYNLKVKDGLDYANFKIDEVVKAFTFAVDTAAPTITVKSAEPNKIVLLFNEDVTNLNDANVEFYHTYNGVAAYKATKSANGKELTLNFANPLPEGAFKLFLNYVDDNGNQIADLWGNKVAEQTITGTVVSDTVAPTVTKVEASSNTAFLVTFSEAVTGATTASNYEIKDAAGNAVAINGAITNTTGNTYSIPVAPLNGGSYTLTIKGIKDTSINQNKLADYSTTVAIKDIVAPEVTDLDANVAGIQAQLLSTKKVKIVFSEVMDKTSIENKLNYLFGGAALDSKVTVTAVDENKAVVLDFTDAAQVPAGASLSVLRVVDAAGNPIAAPSTTVAVPAQVSAPLFDRAEVTDKNTIKLYFKEVITSAQAADYQVSIDNANYLPAGSITNEVIDGKSVITLTTSQDLPTTAANVYVKTANTVTSKNSFGSLVSINPTAAADKYAPLATAAAAIDSDNDGQVDTFTVKFSENLYVASVQDNDFTVDGYEITGVSVSGDTVTLTVKEKTTSDLSATPKVTLTGTVEDTGRNARTTQDALTATKAASTIVSGVKVVGSVGYTPVTDPIVGDVLTANIAIKDGTTIGSYPVNTDANYKWYYKESPDTVLGTAPTYTVTNDNSGKTICVDVSVNGYTGTATWIASSAVK